MECVNTWDTTDGNVYLSQIIDDIQNHGPIFVAVWNSYIKNHSRKHWTLTLRHWIYKNFVLFKIVITRRGNLKCIIIYILNNTPWVKICHCISCVWMNELLLVVDDGHDHPFSPVYYCICWHMDGGYNRGKNEWV